MQTAEQCPFLQKSQVQLQSFLSILENRLSVERAVSRSPDGTDWLHYHSSCLSRIATLRLWSLTETMHSI